MDNQSHCRLLMEICAYLITYQNVPTKLPSKITRTDSRTSHFWHLKGQIDYD
jgi:hypothetical protein